MIQLETQLFAQMSNKLQGIKLKECLASLPQFRDVQTHSLVDLEGVMIWGYGG